MNNLALNTLTYKRITILLSILVSIITIDILFGDISLFFGNLSGSLPIFLVFILFYLFIQNRIFAFVRENVKEIEKRNNLVRYTFLGMQFLQYILITLLFVLFFSMVLRNAYETWITMIGIGLSYSATVIIFTLLSIRFIRWYKTNKNFLVLLYFIVALVIAFRIISIIPFYEGMLFAIPDLRTGESEIPEYNPIPLFNNIYGISSGTALMLLWISTAILFLHYRKKLGNLRYYSVMILVAAAAAYSMCDFVITPALAPIIGEGVEYWIFTAFQGVLPGIAMGVPYWAISAALKDRNQSIRNFMLLCGFAVSIFIASGSAIVDHAPFPPFGILAVISMQLAAFVLFIALYASAISVSEDISLRHIIRKNLIQQAGFLESIGSSEMEEELIKRTTAISSNEANKLYEITGIQSTVDEVEIKNYLEEVLQELRKNNPR
jgi:hypothetical protein